jgi:CBS domain-containing protein
MTAPFADPAAGTERQRARAELLALTLAPVRDAGVKEALSVDGGLDLLAVCAAMAERHVGHVLVRDGARTGIFTTSDLRDALLRPEPAQRLAVRTVAHWELVSVAADADVFEAWMQMARHRVHRIVVRDGAAILGVLSQLDLMGYVANHSHLIALQIEQATTVAELKQAALQMDALIERLHRSGTRIDALCTIARNLNRQLLARLWTLLAPAALIAASCLIVMGSEGRGEQILKTDQDNALLLRDDAPTDGLDRLAARFSAALIDFGYPPCPGGIMVSNPLWRQPLAAFKDTLRGWMFGGAADGELNLAIFLDAAPVAGDPALLAEARRFVDEHLVDHDAFFARFAQPADRFAEPGGWWTRLTARSRDEVAFDLKKLGTFPIVHGARTLALQHRVHALGTAARLDALAAHGHLPAALARDLNDALQVLMRLKLDNNLRQRAAGAAVDNVVRLADLGTLDRELLRGTLAIIRRFRHHLREHYRLDSL